MSSAHASCRSPKRSLNGNDHAFALAQLAERIVSCDRCPELRSYCAEVARAKRKSFSEWTYWGRPVSGFGDALARIMIVGLAPAAHGANRTGRVFTGDRSGDFLFAALHRAGLANQAHAISRDDGLALGNVWVSAAVRCAPPANKPTPAQQRNCEPFLIEELRLLRPKVIIALGSIGWAAVLRVLAHDGLALPKPRPKFSHGAEVALRKEGESHSAALLGCYHVSQQNTFTGKLTEAMIDAVLARTKALMARSQTESDSALPG